MRIVFGQHELNLGSRELRRSGVLVHVEPRIFDLLVYLIRHRDRLVGRDELIDAIWRGRIVSDASVSSGINAARKAVDDDGDRQAVIKTIHRRGFRFMLSVVETPEATEMQPVKPIPMPSSPAASPVTLSARVRKPSLVVMPFVNLNQEQDAEYFAFGLTEDVIRLLARNPWLDVLSRHSGAAFRDRHLDAREIGAALNVRYLVQGSVVRWGGRVRISADLVSAETGRQLWSESYNVVIDDLLAVQDTMAQQIAAVIEPELGRLERESAVRKPPANMDAWDFYQRGLFHFWSFSIPELSEAATMFARSIELDPDFARAHAGLAYVRVLTAQVGDLDARPRLVQEALALARQAVALDDRDCMAHLVLGRALLMSGQVVDSISALEGAVALNPSFAQGYFALAQTLIAAERPEEAISRLNRATELSPRDPHLWVFHTNLALAHFSLCNYEQAVAYCRRAIRASNATYWAHGLLVASLSQLGWHEDVPAALAALMLVAPDVTMRRAESDVRLIVAPKDLAARLLAGLRKAGLPE